MFKASVVSTAIEKDFEARHPVYHKSRRGGLVMLAGVMLEVRSANMMELAEGAAAFMRYKEEGRYE